MEVALYADIIQEMLGARDSEGIPYMRIYGVWGRIYVDDASKFCQLYGYQHGRRVTSVHSYGGFIWEGYPTLDCLSTPHFHRQCLNTSSLSLRNEWYNGPYIQCSNVLDVYRIEGTVMQTDSGDGSIDSVFFHF